MAGVEGVGVYRVPEASEPCHLVEVIVRDSRGFDVTQFQQEEPGQPPEYWQVAWDERTLNATGDEETSEPPGDVEGTVRFAFFLHYLDPSRPLLTPFGPVSLPEPSNRPERPGMIKYEEP